MVTFRFDKRDKMKLQVKPYIGSIVLLFVAFISLGLPDGLLGIAWPFMSREFSIPIDYLGFILTATTAGYTLSSFLSSTISRKLTIGALLSLSCFLTSLALFVFFSSQSFWLISLFAFVLGLGAGAIDASINTYVAAHYSASIMHFLHASFGVSVTLGALIITSSIQIFDKWRAAYFVVGTAQFILAVLFFINRAKWQNSQSRETSTNNQSFTLYQTLKNPSAYVSMLIFILYTGIELGFGVWIFTLLTTNSFSSQSAGLITAGYWGTFTVGRIITGFMSNKFEEKKLILISMILIVFSFVVVLFNINAVFTSIGILTAGLSMAPVFPGLISDTKNRVGEGHEANTIGIQVAGAALGASILPSLAGIAADEFTTKIIPLVFLIASVTLLLLYLLSKFTRVNNIKGASH
jgi:fucose permease